ncbi:MAG: lyase [Gemmatimonadota bacterium]
MRPLAIALAFTLPLSLSAQQGKVGASEPKTYDTPWTNTRPRDPYVAPSGHVWFVGQTGNYVANLNPKTGEFKRFEIEEGTNPHNLVVDAKGTVWFTGNANGRILRMDPASGKVTTFMMPDPAVKDPHTMIFDKKGDAWFTAQNSGFVGRLTQADGKIRLWKMDAGSRPYGIWLDSHDTPWFDLFGTNKLGTIDPKSGEFKAVPLPNERTRPRRIAITPDDVVWYGDYTRGMLGRLDPKSGAVEEFALPSGAGSLPYAMTVDDRGRIWLAETGVQPNRLVAFDPARRAFTENVPIAAEGNNAIRHMVFDKKTRQIWFGGDANMIGRLNVSAPPLIP